jgi:hypothetical protein
LTGRAKRTAAARRRWRDQAARLVVDGDALGWVDREAAVRVIARGQHFERFDVPSVRAHCELILALGRRHRDPDALAVLADWREETGGTLPVTDFPGRPRGGHDLAFTRPARRLLDTLDGRCPWAPSAGAQPDACLTCRGPDCPPLGMTVADVRGGHVAVAPGLHVDWVTCQGLTVVGYDGRRREASVGTAWTGPCPDCQGTGRNLSGYLPPVEDAPQSKWAKAFWAVHVSLGSEEDRARGRMAATIELPPIRAIHVTGEFGT